MGHIPLNYIPNAKLPSKGQLILGKKKISSLLMADGLFGYCLPSQLKEEAKIPLLDGVIPVRLLVLNRGDDMEPLCACMFFLMALGSITGFALPSRWDL